MTHLSYRPHIDGLRAIAVVSVVLFHLGATFLPGGFVGVDVFFVISGFLISRIIYAGVETGEFTVIGFYERRARRILPAFFAVTAMTLAGSYLLLLPPEFEAFARSVLAALAFVPNIFFYLTADYFAPAAETMPILHYWSLGVEEQFYFVFPLIVIVMFRAAPKALAASIAVLLAGSLAASEIAVSSSPQAAFYLLPFRAWEMLVGSVVALPSARSTLSARAAGGVSAAGLALILTSLIWLTKNSPFPGITALPATVGAGLILWGSDSTPNRISRQLGNPVMTFLGRISYSLYLVHWPLILFASRLYPYANPVVRSAVVAALSIALATALRRLVEQPFRNRSLVGRKAIFGFTGASIVALAFVSIPVVHFQGFPGRLDAKINHLLAYTAYDYKPQFRSGACFLDPDQSAVAFRADECMPKPGSKSAILWGDSAIAQLYIGFQKPMEEAGYSLGQLTASACPPIVGLDIAVRPKCREFNDLAFRKIVETKPDILIMAARWWPEREIDLLIQTIDRLRSAGIRPIILGAPVTYRASVPALLAERLRHGNQSQFSDQDLERAYAASTDDILRSRVGANARFISIVTAMCRDAQCPMFANSVTPMHFDSLHLTPAGSKLFAAVLLPDILR